MKRLRLPRRPSALLLMLICPLLALASIAACGGSSSAVVDPLAALHDSVDSYLKPFKGGGDVKVYTEYGGKPQGYIKGDVVLVGGKALSSFHTHLPRSLRATNPDEVGTVVAIKQSWQKVGKYSNGEPAMQDVWRVTVVDFARGRVVGRALLKGNIPPLMADTSMDQNYGEPPWEELLAYLKKLPRR